MKTISNLKALHVFLLLLVMVSCKHQNYNSSDELVKEISDEIAQLKPDSILSIMMNSEEVYHLIDVRQETEHYYGYIPGSINIPRGSLEFNIEDSEYWEGKGLYKPEKKDLILLYCKKGNRSILAAHSLLHLGYKNVKIITGGFKSWELSFPDYTEKNLEMLNGGGNTEHASSGGC